MKTAARFTALVALDHGGFKLPPSAEKRAGADAALGNGRRGPATARPCPARTAAAPAPGDYVPAPLKVLVEGAPSKPAEIHGHNRR